MSRSLVIATLAALATAFVALQGMHKPAAEAHASRPAPKLSAAAVDTAPVLPAIRFFNGHGEAGTPTLTDF